MPARTLAFLAGLVLTVACQAADAPADADTDVDHLPATARTQKPAPEPALPDPASISANELGEIPVLMYHRILPGGGGDYDRSPEEFRAELELLYELGYRPVRMIDVVRGQLDIPAGLSPVVLTFDDSTREQFGLLPDGTPDPATAIGMLLAFAEEHPDFTPVASLYVTASLFGGGRGGGELLAWLGDHGFEIGNHTASHANLRRLDAAGAQRELALGAQVITDAVPGAEVRTMALPLGLWPEPREVAYRGAWEGLTYEHEGILLVGAQPAPSPFAASFDPLAVPRIRSSGWDGGEPNYGSAFWLDLLERHPERRYVSDGDPHRISFPSALADRLAPAYEPRAHPY